MTSPACPICGRRSLPEGLLRHLFYDHAMVNCHQWASRQMHSYSFECPVCGLTVKGDFKRRDVMAQPTGERNRYARERILKAFVEHLGTEHPTEQTIKEHKLLAHLAR